MRILLSSHGASLFGAERVLLALARQFAARGYQIVLEVPHAGPLVSESEALPPTVNVWLSHRARLPRNAREFVRWAIDAPITVIRLFVHIRREKYDVVWVNSLFNPLVAIASRLAGVPVVWHLHERSLPGLVGLLLSLIVRTCATVAITVSDFTAECYARDSRSLVKCEVLRNAEFRGLAPLPERSSEADFVVGYLGQFEPRKRVDDVIHAISCLPEVRGLLVGHGKSWQKSHSLVASLGLGGRIEMPGMRTDPTESLAAMDCVIFSAEDEPFGLVALEAMATGRPVIAARSGALPEVLGDAALYYPVGDVQALVSQIRALMTTPELRTELRERGFQRVQRYSLPRWMDEAEAILHRIVS